MPSTHIGCAPGPAVTGAPRSGWTASCAAHGIAEPVPATPATVAAYLADFAGQLAVSTLARRLYALSAIHRMGGHPVPAEAPEVQAVWSGIKRTHRTAPRQKAATRTKIITRLVKPLGDRPKDVRDRALLLIGFAGAFRRSELVALDVGDITETEDGLHIAVRARSPTRRAPATSSVSPTAPTPRRVPSARGARGSR